MNRTKAIELARYHNFTSSELYDILYKAYVDKNKDYWMQPYKNNLIMDNGYFFNLCVKWIGKITENNQNNKVSEPVTVRILENFGEYSSIQLPIKIKSDIQITLSALPLIDKR